LQAAETLLHPSHGRHPCPLRLTFWHGERPLQSDGERCRISARTLLRHL